MNTKLLVALTLCAGTVLAAGDGSTEPGFVAPPKDKKLPRPPGLVTKLKD